MVSDRNCDQCGKPFRAWRFDQRFCCVGCKNENFNDQRRQAMAAYRAQQPIDERPIDEGMERRA
jgi:hypothetical protein